MSHTPGPWRVGESEACGVTTIDGYSPEKKTPYLVGGVSVYSGGKDTICFISWDEYDKTEREANARLISSAPELLKICKLLLADCESFIEDIGGCDHAVGICVCPEIERIDEARETISKAEGKKDPSTGRFSDEGRSQDA